MDRLAPRRRARRRRARHARRRGRVTDRSSLVGKARRIVVKIGSRTLASDPAVYERMARAIAAHRAARHQIVIVSSGAIALGLRALGWKTRPKEMAKLQAAAAAGQSTLMRRYEEAFEKVDTRVAQVLLTHADLADRARANNARAALDALLEADAVPIINENDTVAVDEIRFGDNDQLAALVASLVSAELLVLLSDVEGLLDRAGARVPVVHDVEREALPLVGAAPLVAGREAVGTGGMGSKLEAARRGTMAGAAVIIADARADTTLERVFAGDDVGTLFVPATEALAARKHWIVFTLRPRGAILVDAGAANALEARGGSLLAVGVLGVRGGFGAGDAVQIVDPTGREIGRGLAAIAAIDVARVAGKRAQEVESVLGRAIDAVVHRDDLVVHRRPER
ncbi:MAG: glutamate 5-kinase [Deltaproteobacteria bacterium]|nr:glutamate 5-kinase [Deltaproteobacteria bacterium]